MANRFGGCFVWALAPFVCCFCVLPFASLFPLAKRKSGWGICGSSCLVCCCVFCVLFQSICRLIGLYMSVYKCLTCLFSCKDRAFSATSATLEEKNKNWTQKWGQPSENFVAARKCFASRFATQQPEHECQHIPFSLCASQGRLLLSRSLYPCFEHFFRPCFRGHDEAGLLAFEALRGSPRPARGRGLPEARPRTQNVMARGQSEAHGDSNLYNTRQD